MTASIKLTRAEKLAAMAAQSASPEEAKVAKSMLAKRPEAKLDSIAADIKAEWGKGVDSQFAIGRLLMQAAGMFPPAQRGKDELGRTAGSPFGDWFRAQEFPFGQNTAWRLRAAAEREPEVRAYIASQSTTTARTGREVGVTTALERLNAGSKDADTERVRKTGEVLPITDATPVSPVYAAFRELDRLLGGVDDVPNALLSEHVADLTKEAQFIQRWAGLYAEAKKARSGK